MNNKFLSKQLNDSRLFTIIQYKNINFYLSLLTNCGFFSVWWSLYIDIAQE